MVAHEAPRLLSRERFGYWIDLLIFPPLALGIALYDCRSVTWMVWATAGVLPLDPDRILDAPHAVARLFLARHA